MRVIVRRVCRHPISLTATAPPALPSRRQFMLRSPFKSPVLVFGDDGLADHIRRPGAGEEVVVLLPYLVGSSKPGDLRGHRRPHPRLLLLGAADLVSTMSIMKSARDSTTQLNQICCAPVQPSPVRSFSTAVSLPNRKGGDQTTSASVPAGRPELWKPSRFLFGIPSPQQVWNRASDRA